jgi:glucose/arabinose dehydrogenase
MLTAGLVACGSGGAGSADTSTTGTAPLTTSTTSAASTPPTTTASTNPPDLAAVHIKLTPVAHVDQPVFVALRPGDATTTYIASRTGTLRALRNSVFDPKSVLDISDRISTGGELGFLGFAFSSDGSHLYVDYTDKSHHTHIDEYAVAADGTVDMSTRRQVLFVDQPFPNHKGGEIIFGPDGYLYVGLGDGGSEGDPQRNGQKLDTLLAKILRIDPEQQGSAPYSVPPDNPFVGQSGAREETWSYGLRNPWRFSFDALTHDLWIGDVGQDTIEEIDHATVTQGAGKGVNFGWSAYEGTNRFNKDQTPSNAVGPVFEYTHQATDGCAVTGGYVYRGSAIPALAGAYLYSDYCEGGVRAITVSADGMASAPVMLSDGPKTVTSFGEGPGRELYVCSFDGTIYRLDPA